jgi:endo-1,4-beta-xylanase
VLKRFTDLGVEVAFTELDIRHSSLPASASALVTQGNDYASVVGGCLDTAGCIGVTVWGFTDKYSWIPDTFSGQGDALLYDSSFNKKAAWTSVSSVLAAKATNVVSSTSTKASTTTTSSATTLSTSTKTSTTLVTSTKASTTSTSTTSTKTTSTVATTTSANAATQTHWGQCGGLYYTGPTACASPYTCVYSNDWYSQCL